MNFWLRASPVLFLAAVAACTEPPPPPEPLPTPPSIKSFTASKDRIALGEEVTLSWTTENATEVQIVDQLGAKAFTSGVASGTAVVKPAVSSIYVLRARGEGGSATSFVQVAVDEDLKTVFLVAVPPAIEAGEKVQLVWSAFHARDAKITASTSEEFALEAARGSGTLEVAPQQSTTFTLEATNAAGEPLSAVAVVGVRPVIESFTVEPAAADPGGTITFNWETRGAGSVVIDDPSFGELFRAVAPAQKALVDSGSFEWTIPETYPSGAAVRVGAPLKLRLVASDPQGEITLTRTVDGHVGSAPRILMLDAPAAVTLGSDLTLSWLTANATRLQVLANGLPVYEALPSETKRMANGQLRLPGPAMDSVYELRIWSHLGLTATEQRTVRAVAAPQITSFDLPLFVATTGDPATATWATTGATTVIIRVKDGAAVLRETDAADVANGTGFVYPGVDATFVLEAYNDAGDKAVAEDSIGVSVPAVMTAGPSPATPDTQLTIDWDLPAATTANVVGDLDQFRTKLNPGDFLDLEFHVDAKELAFADRDNGIAQVKLGQPFTFPLGGQMFEAFWVSTNGFVARENIGARPANQPLNAATGVAPIIAPFWDDLTLGDNGRVLWLLDFTTSPARLVIQWDKVEVATDPQTELSFQVQLFETGELRLGYKHLSGTDAFGQNASIGWRVSAHASLNEELATVGTALLVDGDEYSFFDAGRVKGTVVAEADRPSVFTIFGRLQNNRYVVYPARVNVIQPNSVLVNELMPAPAAGVAAGQWVELLNVSSETVDIGGTVLGVTAGSWTVPFGTTLAPGDYLVVGASTDPAENDGAGVDVAWTGFALDPALDDTVRLTAQGEISSLGYLAASVTPGTSVVSPDKAITSSGAPMTCARTLTYGANGAFGTPGARNETCFGYYVTSIPAQYRDISATGTALFPPGQSNMDDTFKVVSIAEAPFTYFGTPASVVTADTNGHLQMSAASTYFRVNQTVPGASPSGEIAVFWDDLDNDHSGTGNVFYERVPAGADPQSPSGHWIFQWHHFTFYNSSPDDDMNFQAKLFDDGTIEFHYATMKSGTTNNYASGSSATVWLERPAADAALPIAINQPVIQPNTAFRFTPAQ